VFDNTVVPSTVIEPVPEKASLNTEAAHFSIVRFAAIARPRGFLEIMLYKSSKIVTSVF
jgi:hypothetical protein